MGVIKTSIKAAKNNITMAIIISNKQSYKILQNLSLLNSFFIMATPSIPPANVPIK